MAYQKEKSTMHVIRAQTAEELCKNVNEFGRDKKDIYCESPRYVDGAWMAFIWWK